MRLVNKFYSFIKSIYLNNSKYSNNLRHTLRIFFEREVKTKHTPALFGSTFKGSKWVDYQTFNIKKLFIKSGLSYFYYVLTTISLVFILLGRSKAEQYFGFLPFFSYINFILGYIPLILGDVLSQVILSSYILYITVYKLLYTLLNKITLNTLEGLNFKYSTNLNTYNKYTTTNTTTLFNLFPTKMINSNDNSASIFSKILSLTNQNILNTTYLPHNGTLNSSNALRAGNDLLNATLKLKYIGNSYDCANSITLGESFYVDTMSNTNFKTRNSQVTLNDIYSILRGSNIPSNFSFNLENNLNVAKQQRWFARNSLLSESLTPNSFLVTQVKKLLGTGLLDSNFTNKTLWLPTKSSKLSSMESSKYFSNLSTQLFNNNINQNNYLNVTNLNNPNFTNLNFFENSRMWLFKKYFFTNNQNQNIISNTAVSLEHSNKLNSVKNTINLNFNTNLYMLNILPLVSNSLSPSLNNNNVSEYDSTSIKPLTTFINLHTNTLDTFTGSNINFVFNITSNPQQLNTGITNYFTTLTSIDTPLLSSDASKNIKFHN